MAKHANIRRKQFRDNCLELVLHSQIPAPIAKTLSIILNYMRRATNYTIAWITEAKIAEITGLHVRNIERHLAIIKKTKLLNVHPIGMKNVRLLEERFNCDVGTYEHRRNFYTINRGNKFWAGDVSATRYVMKIFVAESEKNSQKRRERAAKRSGENSRNPTETPVFRPPAEPRNPTETPGQPSSYEEKTPPTNVAAVFSSHIRCGDDATASPPHLTTKNIASHADISPGKQYVAAQATEIARIKEIFESEMGNTPADSVRILNIERTGEIQMDKLTTVITLVEESASKKSLHSDSEIAELLQQKWGELFKIYCDAGYRKITPEILARHLIHILNETLNGRYSLGWALESCWERLRKCFKLIFNKEEKEIVELLYMLMMNLPNQRARQFAGHEPGYNDIDEAPDADITATYARINGTSPPAEVIRYVLRKARTGAYDA